MAAMTPFAVELAVSVATFVSVTFSSESTLSGLCPSNMGSVAIVLASTAASLALALPALMSGCKGQTRAATLLAGVAVAVAMAASEWSYFGLQVHPAT